MMTSLDLGYCEICEDAPATRRAEYCAARLCDDCAETEPCAYTSVSECAMASERMVAGVSDEIPACPEHGDWEE